MFGPEFKKRLFKHARIIFGAVFIFFGFSMLANGDNGGIIVAIPGYILCFWVVYDLTIGKKKKK